MNLEQMKLVKSMFKKKEGGRKGDIEEKILKVAQFAYPPLKALEIAGQRVQKLREEIGADVCGFFAEEYSCFEAGGIQLDQQKFLKDLEREIVKKELSEGQGNEEPAPHSAVSCTVC
eukprot:Skav206878  [mRNA]  locus=scaffold5240:1979:2329:- [translate_table: standard]